MKILRLLNDKLEEYLMVVLVIFMTGLIFLQVIMRYVFQHSLGWSEELARYVFLWSIWIGASYGAKTKTHVRLTILVSKFKPKVQQVINIVAYLIWVAFVIFLVVRGFQLVGIMYSSGQISTALHLPMWIAYASVPVGCSLMLFRLIQNGVYQIRHRGEQPAAGSEEKEEVTKS